MLQGVVYVLMNCRVTENYLVLLPVPVLYPCLRCTDTNSEDSAVDIYVTILGTECSKLATMSTFPCIDMSMAKRMYLNQTRLVSRKTDCLQWIDYNGNVLTPEKPLVWYCCFRFSA